MKIPGRNAGARKKLRKINKKTIAAKLSAAQTLTGPKRMAAMAGVRRDKAILMKRRSQALIRGYRMADKILAKIL